VAVITRIDTGATMTTIVVMVGTPAVIMAIAATITAIMTVIGGRYDHTTL